MKTLAADLIADDTFNIACVIACVLLIIAAVMAVLERAWTFALLSAGMAVFVFAWVTIS